MFDDQFYPWLLYLGISPSFSWCKIKSFQKKLNIPEAIESWWKTPLNNQQNSNLENKEDNNDFRYNRNIFSPNKTQPT